MYVCRQVWKRDLSRYCGTVCNASLVSLAKPIVVLRQRFVKYTSLLILAIIPPLSFFLSFLWHTRGSGWFLVMTSQDMVLIPNHFLCLHLATWVATAAPHRKSKTSRLCAVRKNHCKTLDSKIFATSKCLLGFLNVYNRFLSLEEDSLRPCRMSNFKLTSPR